MASVRDNMELRRLGVKRKIGPAYRHLPRLSSDLVATAIPGPRKCPSSEDMLHLASGLSYSKPKNLTRRLYIGTHPHRVPRCSTDTVPIIQELDVLAGCWGWLEFAEAPEVCPLHNWRERT